MARDYPQLTRLTEIFVQQYERYLPSAFDESMSILQKLNKIIEFMNQTGILVNSAVDLIETAIEAQDLDITALQKEVLDFRTDISLQQSNFETEITENLLPANIDIVLSDWYANGSLANIINQDVFSDINAEIQQRAIKGQITGSDFNLSSDATKIKLINLSTEVMNALTGNAPALATIADGGVVNEKLASGSVSTDKLDMTLKRRGFSQVKQGIDPAYSEPTSWYLPTTPIGTSVVVVKPNAGTFLEGDSYIEMTRNDTNVNIFTFVELDRKYKKNTSKKVRVEVTYISTVPTTLTIYQRDIVSPSGLLTNANMILPSTGGIEKTVDIVCSIMSIGNYIVPTLSSVAGATIKVGSVKVGVLTSGKEILESTQRTPIGEFISFWSGFDNEFINFDFVGGEVEIPVGGMVFRNKLKLFTGYTPNANTVSGSDSFAIPIAVAGGANTLHGLFYNAKLAETVSDVAQLMVTLPHTTFTTLSEDYVLLATFSKNGSVSMGGSYSVNGNYLGIVTPENESVIVPPQEGRNVFTSTTNTTLMEITTPQTSIKDSDFIGSNNVAFTAEVGLYSIGKQFNRLRDLIFKNFKGGVGLKVGNTVGTHSTLTASDLLFLANNIGFLSDVRAEYIVISNSQFNGNTVGARITGGNVQLANCMISDNVNGVEILAGANDSHGILSDCQINHNTGYGLIIDGIVNGHTISGSHFYDSDIWVKNTTTNAVRFDNCVIASPLKLENNTLVIFNNCYFPDGYLTLANFVNTNTVIKGSGNEVSDPTLKAIFNTE